MRTIFYLVKKSLSNKEPGSRGQGEPGSPI